MFQNTSDWQEVFDLTYRDLGLNIIRLPFNSYCGDGGGNIVKSELEVFGKLCKPCRGIRHNRLYDDLLERPG
ncbi:MAG: hypothetical protein L6V93_06095 [Clostridiales bacterium]|nr:MAG: hypothetical protein L6V93_06095 [Clostridiales bacterium]